MTRFGIIGCGGAAVGAVQAMRASRHTAPVMVHDVVPALAAGFGERFALPCTTDLSTLLADASVDAVYIAVPHAYLAPVAEQALRAGKHVLVEKPMALTLADADRLIALADERGLALGVFYEYRLAGSYAQARELVQAGALGRITAVRVETLIDKPLQYWEAGLTGAARTPWRARLDEAGGGVVMMNTSHQLDALRYITGLEITRVAAEIGTLTAQVEVEDLASASLQFSNGALGTLLAGAHLPGETAGERLTLYGINGQLRLPDPYSDSPDEVVQLYLHEPRLNFAGGWHSLPRVHVPVFAEAIERFALAVQHGTPPPITGREARRVLAVILALYQSAAEGRAIHIPTDEAPHAGD